MEIAVIDLGSNSLRMGLYKYNSGLIMTNQYRFSTRLAEGLGTDNILKKEPMDRTVKGFIDFKKIIDEHGVNCVKAVATESLRRGKNSKEFIERIKNETGIEIEIISGEDETKYGLYAASLTTKSNDFYMIDTGGGSCEIALVENNKLINHICLPLGAVVLTESFNPDNFGLVAINRDILQEFSKLDWIKNNSYPIVVLGGSNRLLAKIMLKTKDDDVIDQAVVSVETANEIFNMIYNTNVKDRKKIIGMDSNRIDTITAGLCPLLNLCKLTKAQEIITCVRSLRDGIAAEIFENGV